MTLADARGVEIAPGDVVIYGFTVGRSVAMAEAVALGKAGALPEHGVSRTEVSLTPSGRVRLRVVRRSYSSGTQPVVDVAPDRLVVLKRRGGRVLKGWDHGAPIVGSAEPFLPPSPLPTQEEANREEAERRVAFHQDQILLNESGWPLPAYWTSKGRDEHLRWHRKQLAEEQGKLT